MRRGRRLTFSSLVTLGWLASLAATAGLWATSYRGNGQQGVYCPTAHWTAAVISRAGALHVGFINGLNNETNHDWRVRTRMNRHLPQRHLIDRTAAAVRDEYHPPPPSSGPKPPVKLLVRSGDSWHFQLGDSICMMRDFCGYKRHKPYEPAFSNSLSIRYSAVTAALVLLTCAFWFVVLRRWIRRARGGRACLCSHCAYDLRASPDRCPECGTAVGEARKEEPQMHT